MPARPAITPRMLTTEQAAAYCGLSVNSFRAYVRIPPVNFGKSVRFDVRDLDDHLDSYRQSAPSRSFSERVGHANGENRGA